MNRKIVAYLLGFFTFLIVYNTLIPFKFEYGFSDLPEQLKLVQWIPHLTGKERLSLTDVVGNILLFMPFGFLLYMFLNYRGSSHPIARSVLAGAVLSFCIEFIQLFIPERKTGLHDLFNNTLGTWIGAVIAMIYSHRVSAIARRIFYDLLNRKPFLLIVVIIGLAQFVAAVMPFTVSITYSDVAKSVKSLNPVPFTYHSIGAIFFNEPNKHDIEPFDITPMIEDMLFWAVIGYLLMLCYRIYWKKKAYGKMVLWGLPLVYFPFLEGCQLFIMGRTTDINDIISGYLGIALGFFLYRQLRPLRRKMHRRDLDLLVIPLAMYLVFIVFSGLRPFDWLYAPDATLSDWRLENLVPFYAYFRHTSLWNIYDLADSLCYFLPISLYWSYILKEKGVPYSQIYWRTTLAGFLLGAFIELTQLFSVERIAEITDILAYAGGGAIGTFLIYYHERQVVPTLHRIREGVLHLG